MSPQNPDLITPLLTIRIQSPHPIPLTMNFFALLILVGTCTGQSTITTDFECDAGFYYDKENDVCARSKCMCTNGIPVSSDACPEHGGHMCFECDDNYFLDDNDRCRSDDERDAPTDLKEHKAVVCRNGNVRKANMTLVDWLKTEEFLTCTDLLLNVRVGNSGDHGVKAVAAALIRAGSKSHLQHLILTGGAITDEGAEWIAAALGADIPEYEEDGASMTVSVDDSWIEDAASDMMVGPFEDEYEKNRASQIADVLRGTIGTVHLPKSRKKGVGLAPVVDVNLFKNRIGDSGAEAIAEALRVNQQIRTMHLSHNMITATGFKALHAVVKSKDGAHIEQLWLDGNSFDDESRKIRPLMEQMRRLLDKNERRGLRKRGIKHEL